MISTSGMAAVTPCSAASGPLGAVRQMPASGRQIATVRAQHPRYGRPTAPQERPGGFYCEQYPRSPPWSGDHDQYQWRMPAAWRESQRNDKREQPLSIYELHVGSRKRHPNGDSLNWRELAVELELHQRWEYTHIELLPASEHPFSGSWGYQPVGMFSPTSRYGTADDFKYFVDQCHQAGIGVILDYGARPLPVRCPRPGRFDGTPLYEYEDPRRGWHPDWNSMDL